MVVLVVVADNFQAVNCFYAGLLCGQWILQVSCVMVKNNVYPSGVWSPQQHAGDEASLILNLCVCRPMRLCTLSFFRIQKVYLGTKKQCFGYSLQLHPH